jgi:hypothetical protein
VAPNGSDLAAAGTSTAFNVGITAGAFLGGVLLPATGLRRTALAGAALTLVAFAVVLAEPAVSSRQPAAQPFEVIGEHVHDRREATGPQALSGRRREATGPGPYSAGA